MSRCPRKSKDQSSQLSTEQEALPKNMMVPEPTSTTTVTNHTVNAELSYVPALLTAVSSRSHVHLIIGDNALAAARCTRSIEVGAIVKVVAPENTVSHMHHGVRKRIDDGEVEWIDRDFQVEDLTTLGREEVDSVVDAVFVTLDARGEEAAFISAKCKRLRIPVNVADSQSLSTFTLLSTYIDGPLQIGITTSGMGCKLASRLRRTVTKSFPPGIGLACERLGRLRRQIWDEDCKNLNASILEVEEDDSGDQKATFNILVKPDDEESQKSRRIRWLSQICEYWPLQKLCDLTDQDIDTLFNEYVTSGGTSLNEEVIQNQKGTISLVGSGPGDPNLLTKASIDAINSADLVLADKLVPEQVLALIPRRTSIFIARKFPGNADKAQEELLEKGLAAVQAGQNVVRLKQGDPYIYGRGAEEFEFFERHGINVNVLPGITSALSAPLFAAIPATHRSVADQVLICTGTGRKGAAPEPPAYNPSQTTVFLMACHRLRALIDSLVASKGWPGELPCAVIERASCPDQRVIRSTLKDICAAVDELGSRPPGLFVTGWACEVLRKPKGDWIVEEGVSNSSVSS